MKAGNCGCNAGSPHRHDTDEEMSKLQHERDAAILQNGALKSEKDETLLGYLRATRRAEDAERLKSEAVELLEEILREEWGFAVGDYERLTKKLNDLRKPLKRSDPVPIRPGCLCGPEGKCDYHRVTL